MIVTVFGACHFRCFITVACGCFAYRLKSCVPGWLVTNTSRVSLLSEVDMTGLLSSLHQDYLNSGKIILDKTSLCFCTNKTWSTFLSAETIHSLTNTSRVTQAQGTIYYIFLIYKITLEKIHSCPIIKNITLFSEG